MKPQMRFLWLLGGVLSAKHWVFGETVEKTSVKEYQLLFKNRKKGILHMLSSLAQSLFSPL